MIKKEKIRKPPLNLHTLVILLILTFAIGVTVGSMLDVFSIAPIGKGGSDLGNPEGTFRFIRASTVSTGRGNGQYTRELKPFRYKINELIEEKLSSGDASTVSVYFRDLNNGNWLGVREHDTFAPVSLLKIPLMIAYFKWAESSPVVLRKTLTYTGKEKVAGQDGEDLSTHLEPGKTYTVNELIFRMIAHNDAAAYALLYTNMPSGRLDKIFKDLYVEYDPRRQEDSLSLNSFASFFRVLYNASYLSEEMSEKALRYLSRSSFQDGMAAGIPRNIEIASKEGERMVSVIAAGQEQKLYQLHEFGIVYYPTRPFLLGIMTRGKDLNRLAKVIRDITRLVYEEVDKQS